MAPRPFLAKNAHSLFLLFQVEAIIHPQFLADLLSPEPQLDPLALAEELEQEEGLTPEEVSRRGRDTYGACGCVLFLLLPLLLFSMIGFLKYITADEGRGFPEWSSEWL